MRFCSGVMEIDLKIFKVIIRLKSLIVFLLTILMHSPGWAQVQTKTYVTTKVASSIKIDGEMTESAWQTANIATDFVERNPTEGKPPRFKTEARILYDDNNIYILGYCFDDNPDSILTQLGERDDRLNADLFSVSFDPYNKMLDAFKFSVTASGVQADSRISDPSFNTVWESAVKIVDNGWIVEMKIPYYAIRFPKQEEQLWRLQFEREIRRSRQELQWCLVPKKVETRLNYWGELKGLNNIKDPMRLSLSPYVSTFGQLINNQLTTGFGAGADLKYGLNESFTLDLTLLPDFSQIRSDNVVKNLGAFEVVFEEQRPFFQEGIDLFNNGGLFYSRRIGGTPVNLSNAYSSLDSNETVINNPINSNLINVAKVSGRNKKGLGIGVMNAITAPSYATIQNNEDTSTRMVQTNPLVNYNIVSFDQNLKSNSSIYFINLNTTRMDGYEDANVTAAGGVFVTKKSKYSVTGDLKISQKDTLLSRNFIRANEKDGSSYSLSFGKIKGNFKYRLSTENKSPNYNPNDLGVNFTTNIRTHSLNLQYNKYNPFWILNGSYNNLTFNVEQDYTTNQILKKKYNGRYFFLFPSFDALFVTMSSQVGDGIDLFESRVTGQPFIIPEWYFNGIGISTDYRKKFAFDGDVGFGKGYFTNYISNEYFEVNGAPIIRLSDKLTLRPSVSYSMFFNGVGFAGYYDNQPKYGVRDVRTLTNIFQGKYLFKNNLSLTVRFRHYWSYGLYDYYGDLDSEGYIVKDESFTGNSDFNYNAFNTDIVFGWQFAPGSFLNVVYKNSLQQDGQQIERSYFRNVTSVFDDNQLNTLTMKVIYFFDTVSSYKKLFKKQPTL